MIVTGVPVWTCCCKAERGLPSYIIIVTLTDDQSPHQGPAVSDLRLSQNGRIHEIGYHDSVVRSLTVSLATCTGYLAKM